MLFTNSSKSTLVYRVNQGYRFSQWRDCGEILVLAEKCDIMVNSYFLEGLKEFRGGAVFQKKID